MTAITDAIATLTQAIYLHKTVYAGNHPTKNPAEHQTYLRNKATRDVLNQWLDGGRPITLEESITDLAHAINGDTK
jgi:hypothetical protein